MTTDAATAVGSSRTVLVSFLGAIVRKQGGWMPIAGAVDLLGEVGVDDSSVRSAVSRLKNRGWLAAEKRSGVKGYALTRLANDELSAGDAIVWHAPQAAPLVEGWCIVNFSIPETERAIRHQLRARLTLAGFGRAGAAVWIAPARALESARRVIRELDLASRCTLFVGHYEGERDLREIAREGWSLDDLEDRYDTFIETVGTRVEKLGAVEFVEPVVAFSHYLATIDQWRRLPYEDPGLPIELVGESWPAARAGALFEKTVTAFEGVALDHAGSRWPAA